MFYVEKYQDMYPVGLLVLNSFLFVYSMNAKYYGTILPAYKIAYSNTNVFITCKSSGPTTWYKDGELDIRLDILGSDLVIRNISEDFTGDYTCKGSLPNGDPFSVTATILVGDKDNKIFPKLVSVSTGKYVKFECEDGENIQWHYESSKDLPESPPIAYGKTFNIVSVTPFNSGTYFCYGKYLKSDKHFVAKSKLIVYASKSKPGDSGSKISVDLQNVKRMYEQKGPSASPLLKKPPPRRQMTPERQLSPQEHISSLGKSSPLSVDQFGSEMAVKEERWHGHDGSKTSLELENLRKKYEQRNPMPPLPTGPPPRRPMTPERQLSPQRHTTSIRQSLSNSLGEFGSGTDEKWSSYVEPKASVQLENLKKIFEKRNPTPPISRGPPPRRAMTPERQLSPQRQPSSTRQYSPHPQDKFDSNTDGKWSGYVEPEASVQLENLKKIYERRNPTPPISGGPPPRRAITPERQLSPQRQPSSTRQYSPHPEDKLDSYADFTYNTTDEFYFKHPIATIIENNPQYFEKFQKNFKLEISTEDDLTEDWSINASPSFKGPLHRRSMTPERQLSPQTQLSSIRQSSPRSLDNFGSETGDKDKSCPALNLNNGEVSYQNNDKQIAVYRCSVGYKLNGPIQRYCQNGQWSGNSPTCQSASSNQLLYGQNIVLYYALVAIVTTTKFN